MGWRRGAVTLGLCAFAVAAQAQDVRLPVLVPLTGFVALEGTSQRNGALLAASQSRDVVFKPDVLDTAATPELQAGLEESFGGGGWTALQRSALLQMTWDHVSSGLDGRESVAFLKHIKELVERPTRMLLGI